ncbi:hypothetical protein GDO81_015691 [Engystomops pustulosus]|uniref:Uncharacterized protein n=1 Tax=Engystomops pustulosus TaxID=76066 RepID=A0AAV7ATA1_ENGPU|nr:hypothetical protein GDO81_015691 [Engystomops pustulosus]
MNSPAIQYNSIWIYIIHYILHYSEAGEGLLPRSRVQPSPPHMASVLYLENVQKVEETRCPLLQKQDSPEPQCCCYDTGRPL